MNPVKRVLLVLAATAMLLLAFTAVAGAQTVNPAYPLTNVGAGGAGRGTTGTSGTGSRLALTGSNHDVEFALVGLAAVVVGGGLVTMSRRRRAVVQV